MANIAAKLSLNVPAITALCKGDPGFSTRSGAGAPSPAIGINGDFYIDTLVYNIYGPKTAGNWGSPTQLSNVSDSPRWNSSYATVSALSASWNSTRTSVFNLSADWSSVYSTTRAYSGDWNSGLTMAQSVSTNVFANSGSWRSTNTAVYNNSGRWESVYSYVNNTSGATIGAALTVLFNNSANWNSTYSSVYNTSASWDNGSSAYTSFRANSADFISTEISVFNTSGTWNSTNTSVFNNSGSWDSTNTSVFNTSSRWNNAWTYLNTSSASLDDTNSTVWTFSASWGGPRTDAVYTSVYNNSGNWNNVYNFWNTSFTPYSAALENRVASLEGLVDDIDGGISNVRFIPIQSGTIDINLQSARTFVTKVSANINTINFTNPNPGTTTFTLLLSADGNTRTVAWPVRVVWDSGVTPLLTTDLNRTDIFTFISVNSGKKYFGTFVGSAYP